MSHNFSSSLALNHTLNNSNSASLISNGGGLGSSIPPGTSILHQIFPNSASNNLSSTQSLNHHKLSNTTSSAEKRAGSDTDHIKSHVASRPPGFNVEDSAIIHVNTTQLGAPILMTPDAFVNSPNNQSNSMRKSLNSSDIKPPGIDLIQSLMSSANAAGLSTNVSQSLNLTSSRASSLTQVTANTNNMPATVPVSNNLSSLSLNNNNNIKLLSSSNQNNGNGTSNNTNNNNKRLGKKLRNRATVAAAAPASSSTSSSSTTSTTSSSDSDLDPTDKEIASLSAKSDRAKKLYANDKQSEFMLLNNVSFWKKNWDIGVQFEK